MKIEVKFFGLHREKVGENKLVLELQEGITIKELLRLLTDKYPILKKLEEFTLVSLNQSYATDKDIKLKDGDEVALFPPVSGG